MVCIAQTLQQLTKNAISELEMFFHPSEIQRKTIDAWYLKNGGVIEFWPSDDPDKLRSANVNFIWIVEGHTPKMKLMYNEGMARIRNQKGFIYEYDSEGNIKYETGLNGQTKPKISKVMNMILVEANPEPGAWTNKAILNAHTILYTPKVKGIPILENTTKPSRHLSIFTNKENNADIVGILNATIDNPILPESYFTNLHSTCKSEKEYNRIIYCDITSQDGLVFNNVIESPNNFFAEINNINLMKEDNVFVETFDPGGSNSTNDPDAYLLGVFDKKYKQLQIIDGFKISGMNLSDVTKRIWDIRNKWGWRREKHFIFVSDNSIGKSSKIDRTKSLKNDYEIRLTTAIIPCNDKGISFGINLLNQWLDNRAILFSSRLDFLKNEMFSYEKFERGVLSKVTQEIVYRDVYTEVNNHVIDALRYLIVILEAYGFRQDQHLIDYARTSGNTYETHTERLQNKADPRRFLPGGDFSFNVNKINKKIVF